ncbi:MAG: hypothetical protein U9Q12_00575 [Patescibacteria group bacterium]|nr:hypothetical protein [Patescibacteria group bacterium]
MFEKNNVNELDKSSEQGYVEKVKSSSLDMVNARMYKHPLFKPFATAATILALSSPVKAEKVQSMSEKPTINYSQKYEIDRFQVIKRINKTTYHSGKLRDYFPNQIPGEVKGYETYSENEKCQEIFEKYGRAFYQGAAAAELDFGLMPGDAVDKIACVDTEIKNAESAPDSNVVISYACIERMELGDDVDMEYSTKKLAYHEVIHSIDREYGIQMSYYNTLFTKAKEANMSVGDYLNKKLDDPVLDFYKFSDEISKKSWFMHNLAEGEFLDKSGITEYAGHPEDNSNELFATFLTTMSDPYQLQIVEEQTTEFKVHYLQTAKQIAGIIKYNDAFDQNAPVIQRIDGVIKTLENKIFKRTD